MRPVGVAVAWSTYTNRVDRSRSTFPVSPRSKRAMFEVR